MAMFRSESRATKNGAPQLAASRKDQAAATDGELSRLPEKVGRSTARPPLARIFFSGRLLAKAAAEGALPGCLYPLSGKADTGADIAE
jgi:hypothetical protein